MLPEGFPLPVSHPALQSCVSPLLPAPLSTLNIKAAIQMLTLDVSTQAGCITPTSVYSDTRWSFLFTSIPLLCPLGEAKVTQP